MREVWKTGKPSGELDFTVQDPAGSALPYHYIASFFPVRVESGEMLGVGVVVLDISERVRAEKEKAAIFDQLEIERARFEAILEQMPSAVIIGEAPKGRLVLGNPQVGKVFGHDFRSVQDVADYSGAYRGFHADGTELRAEEWPLARAILHGETTEGEEVIIERGDGSMGVIRLNAAPILDKDQNISGGIVVFDDVTQRARADAAQRFLAEASSALISTISEDEAFEKLAQLCVPRVADWCVIAVPGDDGLLHHAAIAHADSAKAPAAARFKTQLAIDPQLPWDIEGAMHGKRAVLYPRHSIEHLREIHASDEYVQLIEQIGAQSAIVAPLEARGRIVGVMIWISAESKRQYDERDLELADELAKRAALTADNARLLFEAQTARDEAQNANRAKDEFLAVVSHELRTPLTPILGWLELLQQDGADDLLRQQAYAVIGRNANAQAPLVNDILDVSRITTGKLRLDLQNHALAPLVSTAVESLKTVATEKGLQLETHIEDVGQVRADANRLQQVVWNLLQNAIKFTPAPGKIVVCLERTAADRAKISVKDSGQGIDSEFLPHVFDRFRQADSSSTRKQGGLGLGLAIVTHIVELHGGEVGAHSEGLGKGATFSVELPLTSPLPESNGEATSAPRAPIAVSERLKNVRILLVDDEPDTRETLARLLDNAGATIRTAPSGKRALEIVPQFWPDIVISDIGMPEMDGYELRAILRERWDDVPAIALTAYAAPSDVQKALDAGFERHLSKPIHGTELVEAVEAVLRTKKSG